MSAMKPDAWMYTRMLSPNTASDVLLGSPPNSNPELVKQCKQVQPLFTLATVRKWLEEVTDEMTEAGFGPFLASYDLVFVKNEPCGPIWKAMLSAKLRELEDGDAV